jgi:hypothetical protein
MLGLMKTAILAFAPCVALAFGCSGSSGTGVGEQQLEGAGGDASDAAPGSCAAASAGTCSTARAYLSCTNGGVTEGCLSDDLTKCPGTEMVSGGFRSADGAVTESNGPLVCQNQCASNEYGSECGSVGPSGHGGQPAARCRTMGITPGGTEFLCCPCGS